MAYDEKLASRIRKVLRDRSGISERKMFGGLAFMIQGNMACGIVKQDLMLRLGVEGATEALARQHTRVMDFTGKVMRTMLYVSPEGTETDVDLEDWVLAAETFARSLPAK